jgi:hypothetical protein
MYTPWKPDETVAVRVHAILAAQPRSTIALGEGQREDDEYEVTFAGEWRPMLELAHAIADGIEPVAMVPTYAILSQTPPEDVA